MLLFDEAVGKSRLRKAALRSRRWVSERLGATASGRTDIPRRMRWTISESTLRSDPAGSPGVFPTASSASSTGSPRPSMPATSSWPGHRTVAPVVHVVGRRPIEDSSPTTRGTAPSRRPIGQARLWTRAALRGWAPTPCRRSGSLRGGGRTCVGWRRCRRPRFASTGCDSESRPGVAACRRGSSAWRRRA
jgi:hypothetical protein